MKKCVDGFLLYGAGKTGKMLWENVKEFDTFNVVAFVDAYQSGTYHDTPIFQLSEVPSAYKNMPIVISIHNPDVNLKNVEEDLINYGWRKDDILRLPEFYLIAQNAGITLPDMYWLGHCNWECVNERIESAKNLFLDERSLEIFDAEIRYRKTGVWSPQVLEKLDQNVYRPDFIENLKDISFVDGGSYDGDTLEDFIQCGVTFKEIFCFEPDSMNRAALEKRLTSLNIDCPITLFPLGLNNAFEILGFDESGAASSSISKSGSIYIQTGALDSLLRNKPVSYIKMDIEGSEVNALNGCACTIAKYHPIMAVCVYHCPDHLWEVPLFLKKINPNYRLFLRLYTQNCFETVCYAIDDGK